MAKNDSTGGALRKLLEGTNMPTQDRYGNELSCEVGDQILFESDGMVAETYPAQLAAPYSYTIMGHLSDSEISDIAMNIELP